MSHSLGTKIQVAILMAQYESLIMVIRHYNPEEQKIFQKGIE